MEKRLRRTDEVEALFRGGGAVELLGSGGSMAAMVAQRLAGASYDTVLEDARQSVVTRKTQDKLTAPTWLGYQGLAGRQGWNVSCGRRVPACGLPESLS